ncbi:putative ribonuclease H-like domain-containing protein [Tanacetum coccineum]
MTPRAVLLKTSLTPLNNVRPVNTTHLKPAVHSAKSMSHFSKQAQSTAQRPFYKQTALTRRSVHTAKRHYYSKRPRAGNTARSYTGPVNAVREKRIFKREYSIARTPQQNGVAERRNRTLIKAARTILGKFDGKSNKGFFFGYSLSSKAFSVYSTRTRRVEENSHIGFLENKPMIEGNGPKWLFDIDSLTQSMNYVPVAAGTIINESAGTQGELNADGLDNENDEKDKCNDDSSPKEVNAVDKHVWILVDLPIIKRAIGKKWVFRNKKDERGIVIRNKARLVAQGHRQEEGIDYEEVFAPVARIKAIRLFLAYASFMGFLVYQMDVKSAFLYGTIEEEVYVTQPPGFKDPNNPDKVYKVFKTLYGLHQVPRAWYETLANYMLGNRFKRGKIDQTLFIKKQKGDILLVQVYVDDIIFGSTNKELCTGFEKLIKDKFQMSSMGEITFFLGLQVQQKDDGIFIIDLENPLVKDGDADDVDVHLYRSMIGSLMYLTASRPDIMFGVCACAIFQVTPKTSHLLAVKRIFRYLKGKPTLGLLVIIGFLHFELVAYTDSDYDGATQDRKSTTGGYQFLGNRHVKRGRDTKIPQSSGPPVKVGDEAVHKELGDRMERAATTASSLEVEQDSGSGPRCQDTILGDVDAQTRFETTSKQSNDPPLSRGYTLGSGEDSMKLLELMELCTQLSNKNINE